MKYEWKSTYELDSDLVDTQHKRLFELASIAADAVVNDDTEATNNAVRELFDYTIFHFAQEEQFMEQINYAAIDEHRAKHRSLVDDLACLVDIGTIRGDLPKLLDQFIHEWLVKHIINEDMKVKQALA